MLKNIYGVYFLRNATHTSEFILHRSEWKATGEKMAASAPHSNRGMSTSESSRSLHAGTGCRQ
jgi:hypothetical protein